MWFSKRRTENSNCTDLVNLGLHAGHLLQAFRQLHHDTLTRQNDINSDGVQRSCQLERLPTAAAAGCYPPLVGVSRECKA